MIGLVVHPTEHEAALVEVGSVLQDEWIGRAGRFVQVRDGYSEPDFTCTVLVKGVDWKFRLVAEPDAILIGLAEDVVRTFCFFGVFTVKK